MLNIQENIPLSKYTTFRIGGPARYFTEVDSKDELLEALKYAKENNLDFFILGGGSNLLVSDQGFDGLMIKMKLNGFKIVNTDIEAESGVALARVVNSSINEGLTGMEWAAGIPGTVGGAARGNTGAYNKSMADIIESVKALDVNELGIKNYELEDCKYGYKDNIFKQSPNLIVLSVKIKLQKGDKEKSRQEIKEMMDKRKINHPQGVGNVGCFFMNPAITDKKIIDELEKDGIEYKDSQIPAWWLVNEVGLRGKKIGGAMVSEKHTNFIVNTGDATAKDVIMLVSLIKQKIRNKFNIQLQEEVQYLGF